MATIIDYGGNWNNWDISVASGVMCRVMNDTFIDTYVSVAFAQKINRTYTPFGDAYHANVEADLRGYHRQGIESQP